MLNTYPYLLAVFVLNSNMLLNDFLLSLRVLFSAEFFIFGNRLNSTN